MFRSERGRAGRGEASPNYTYRAFAWQRRVDELHVEANRRRRTKLSLDVAARSHRIRRRSEGLRRDVPARESTRRGGRLVLKFTDGDGGAVLSGGHGHSGSVSIDDVVINLNLPSVAAAIIQRALHDGWDPLASGNWSARAFDLLRRSRM